MMTPFCHTGHGKGYGVFAYPAAGVFTYLDRSALL